MAYIAEMVQNYLNGHVAFLLFLCLGFGYIVGKIRIKSIVLGATVGTLLVGILISQFVSVEISDYVKTIFFSLFCFTIGFDVGPSFFSTLKSDGIKIVILSVFFAIIGLLTTYLICLCLGLDVGYGVGLLAGALTQTSIIGAAQLGDIYNQNATITYGLTYLFGTIGVIIFVKNIAPLILRKSLPAIVKEKMDSAKEKAGKKEENPFKDIIQVRAYKLSEKSEYVGKTVLAFEAAGGGRIEIDMVFKNKKPIDFSENYVLEAGDVVRIIGDVEELNIVDNYGLEEVSDSVYYAIRLVDAKIVVTEQFDDNARAVLSACGVLLKGCAKKHAKSTIISVSGTEKSIKKAAKALGYIKDEGNSTDIAFLSIAIAIGLVIGSITIHIGSLPLSIGESVMVLLFGLVCGWWYDRSPRMGHIPQAIRVFLKGLGLNFYIGILALGVGDKFFAAISGNGLLLIGLGVLVTLIPHICALLFGKYVLKISDADLLGGLCGCGTCTAALNALSDETESSVFAVGFAPGCAVGNILLTLTGLLLPLFL